MNKKTFLIAAGCIYLLSISLSLFQGVFIKDEAEYHYPLVQKFSEEFPKFDLENNYSSASTPLPYIILATLGKIIGLNVYSLRLVTLLVSIGTLYYFYKILTIFNVKNIYQVVLLLLIHPYFIQNSVTLYTPVWGMFFGMTSLYYFLNNKKKYAYLVSGILAALAVLSRQYYLFLPASYISYLFLRNIKYREKNLLYALLCISIPQLIYLPVFLVWGGLVHPDFYKHEIGLKADNLVFFFVVIGFYYGWAVGKSITVINKKLIYIFVIAFILFLLFTPEWYKHHGYSFITGIIMHISAIIDKISGFLSEIFLLFLYFTGIALVYRKIIERDFSNEKEFIIYFGLIFYIIIMIFNVRSGERFYLAGIPFIILTFKNFISYRINNIIISPYFCLSISYVYYWFYFS